MSGKSGKGTEALLDAILDRVPPPVGNRHGQLQALVFDTWYDTYRGVVLLLRIKQGSVKAGDRVMLKSTQRWYEVQEAGVMHPEPEPVRRLSAGQVGYIMCNMKQAVEARVGDTLVADAAIPALPGFKAPLPMVYAGIYPMDSSEFDQLNKSMEKLTLNDASVAISRESSNALGLGFRWTTSSVSPRRGGPKSTGVGAAERGCRQVRVPGAAAHGRLQAAPRAGVPGYLAPPPGTPAAGAPGATPFIPRGTSFASRPSRP